MKKILNYKSWLNFKKLKILYHNTKGSSKLSLVYLKVESVYYRYGLWAIIFFTFVCIPSFIIILLYRKIVRSIFFLYKKKIPPSDKKETVLVVSHEASRTGAPILAWNICRELKDKYNIIAIILGEESIAAGSISRFFKEICDIVIDPSKGAVKNYKVMSRIIKSLNKYYKIKFAIVNSFESRFVLKGLSDNAIPSVFLIHEFYAYMSKTEFPLAVQWAGTTVFSSKIVRESATNESTYSLLATTYLLPQGKSFLPMNSSNKLLYETEFAKVKEVIFPANNPAKPFVVLGAATIEYRKGTDLFVATALEIKRLDPKANISMVWIGDSASYQPYTDFVLEHLHHYELQDCCKFINAISTLEQIYPLINVFFLSSRLDPLPNVAIDSMVHGIPVICFEKATGIAEFLEKTPETADCIVPFSNITAAAKKILDFYYSPEYYAAVSEQTKIIANDNFDMQHYVAQLVELAVKQ